MNTIDLVKHPLLSRILDWRSMLQDQDIMWEEFYKTPLWRKWHDKQSGVDNGYEAMHDVIDFNSPKVLKMLQVIASEDPVMHAYHTPTIHEMMAKVNSLIIITTVIVNNNIIIIIIIMFMSHSLYWWPCLRRASS